MLPDTKNENKIKQTENKPQVNTFYLALAARFKTARLVAICVLVVFLLATVILFRDDITVENLRYLFKDLEIGDNISVTSNDEISFDADLQVNLGLFKGDIAIAGSSYFYLTDLQGNKRLNESSAFSNPVISLSDKYLLVYGLSENTYTIYNTFASLHTETLDYPITGGVVSDKGFYAIVTRTAEYRSVVYLYNENFERIGVLSKDKYVTDIAFNKDSSELLIVSVFSNNGNFCTEIVNYVPFSQTASSSITVEGSMPIEASYNIDGGFSVIYDNKIEFYDSEYVLRNTFIYPANVVPQTTYIGKKYTAFTYNENIVGDDIKALVFSNDGELVCEVSAQGQPKCINVFSDTAFVLLDGKLCKINIKNKEVSYYDIERNAIDLLLVDENTAIVCFTDHTRKISIDK